MNIGERFEELRQTGASVDEAVRQIFREDYNANIQELVAASGLDGGHIGRIKGQVSRGRGGRVTPQRESIVQDTMTPPILLQFSEALDDLRVGHTDFREHLCKLFSARTEEFQKDRDALEAFLYRHGLTPIQVNGVVERIMVTPKGQPPTGYQPIPIPGGYLHVIQPGQQGGQGPIILPITGQGGGGTVFQPPPQIISRKVKRERLDEKGNVMTDKSGNPLYEEVEEPLVMGGTTPTVPDQSLVKALEDTRKEVVELRIQQIQDNQREFFTRLEEDRKEERESITESINNLIDSYKEREKTITEAFDRKVKEIEKDRETDRKILSLEHDKEMALKDKELTELRAMHNEVLKKIPTGTEYHPGEPNWLLGAKEIRRGLGEAVDKIRDLAQTMYQMPKPPGTGSQERNAEMDEILKREKGR